METQTETQQQAETTEGQAPVTDDAPHDGQAREEPQEQQQAQGDQRRQSRPSSSEARGRGLRETVDDLGRRLEAQQQMNQQMMGLLQTVLANRQQPGEQPQSKPYREKLARVLAGLQANPDAGYDDFAEALEELAVGATGAQQKRIEALQQEIETLKGSQRDPFEQQMLVDFPWLSDPDYAAIADGKLRSLKKRDGRDFSNKQVLYASMREAAALVAKEHGLGGGKDNPDREIQQQRIAGTSGKDSGAGNSLSTPQLTPAMQALAENLFSNLPPEQAHAKWWKEIGSKMGK